MSLYLREGCWTYASYGSSCSGSFLCIFLSLFYLNFLKALLVFFQRRCECSGCVLGGVESRFGLWF